MIQNFIVNINKISLELILSYWNYLIIKNEINPSLCFTGIKPYLYETLTSEIQFKWLIIVGELHVLEFKYINGIFNECETELSIISEIKNYECQRVELRWYISFLKDIKQIDLFL